ncbi:MAG: hypothetical protein AB1673_14645 [Actinomycetota bacterium]|jgi:hypothetical protein
MSNKTAAALGTGLLLVGLLIGRASANDGGTSAPKPKPEQTTSSGLDPKSYPRTKAGAVTAAAAYDDVIVRAVFMTPEERRKVVNLISNDAMRDQILKDEEGAAAALGKVNGPKVLRRAPLGYRVPTFTKDFAKVEFWQAAVGGQPGVDEGVISGFITKTVELGWERGAWRLAGNPTGKDGPSPEPNNLEASNRIVAEARTFEELDHVAR